MPGCGSILNAHLALTVANGLCVRMSKGGETVWIPRSERHLINIDVHNMYVVFNFIYSVCYYGSSVTASIFPGNRQL